MSKLTQNSGDVSALVPVLTENEDGTFGVSYRNEDPFAVGGVLGASVAGVGMLDEVNDVVDMMNKMKHNYGFQFSPQAVQGGNIKPTYDGLQAAVASGLISYGLQSWDPFNQKPQNQQPTSGASGFASKPYVYERDGQNDPDSRDPASVTDRYGSLGSVDMFGKTVTTEQAIGMVLENLISVAGVPNMFNPGSLMTSYGALVDSGVISPYAVASYPGDGHDIGTVSELGKIAAAMGWQDLNEFGKTMYSALGYGPSNWTESAYDAWAEAFRPEVQESITENPDIFGSGGGGGSGPTGAQNDATGTGSVNNMGPGFRDNVGDGGGNNDGGGRSGGFDADRESEPGGQGGY